MYTNQNTFLSNIDQMLQEFFVESLPNKQPVKTNIFEHKDRFEIQLLSPGLSKDDFEIEVTPEKLEIRATKSEKEKMIWKKSFSLLNISIDLDHVIANYKGGILQIILQKIEQKSQNRTVSIQ